MKQSKENYTIKINKTSFSEIKNIENNVSILNSINNKQINEILKTLWTFKEKNDNEYLEIINSNIKNKIKFINNLLKSENKMISINNFELLKNKSSNLIEKGTVNNILEKSNNCDINVSKLDNTLDNIIQKNNIFKKQNFKFLNNN